MGSASTIADFSGRATRSWKQCGPPRRKAAANGILLRGCIQIANANLKLRMRKFHAAGRLFGEALAELNELGVRKASAVGGGFADAFPAAALAGLLRTKLALPALTKEDWVAIGGAHQT
jgi:hypothetical protein